ncbi:DUF805 domain-containing protein [Methyloligella solikamskensis]|uniref:DUF805 domain-containing protein n=1 Tax=Methyloligella solikamskensis TaxID=1177756 RepID=A0ABW3JCG6_9HYPH
MDLKYWYLTLRGRIGRQTFWMAIVPLLIASWVVSFIVTRITLSMPGNAIMGALGSGMMMLITAVTLIGIIAVCVKRFHDRNKSGWWMAGLYVVSIAQVAVLATSGMAMTETGPMSLGNLLSAVWFGLVLWLIIELGILKGTDGPNEYGPDPLQDAPANTDADA